MSDEFDSMELPDELRDVVGRLRGLRPAAAQASEAECMYRSGWEAALAAQSAPATRTASSWNKSYLGGLLSGALVSGSLAVVWLIGVAKPWAAHETAPDTGTAMEQRVAAAPDALATQPASDEPSHSEPRGPLATAVTPLGTMSDEPIATALLSPVARYQWRTSLTRAAAPYASARTESTSGSAPVAETLRSSPRDIDLTLF